MLCLISASFTGCLEDEVEYTTQEETIQQENGFNVTQELRYYVIVLKVKEKVDLTDLSFYDSTTLEETVLEIGMKIRYGIDTSYSGNNENLKNRAEVIENDDGSTYPVIQIMIEMEKYLPVTSAYGYDVGPYPGWKIDVKDDLTNQIISAKLGEYRYWCRLDDLHFADLKTLKI